MARKSLVGVAADICNFLGVKIDSSLQSQSKYSIRILRLAHFASILAQLINIADITIDIIFVYELWQLPDQRGWSILMGITTILAILLSRSYDSGVMSEALERYGYGFNYAYYFGTNLCISFLLEDFTTLMLFSIVPGAFQRDSMADVLNLVSSLASAVMVSVFILVGGAKLIISGRSADWIPQLAITALAQRVANSISCVGISCVMSLLIFLKCLWIGIVIGWSVYLVFGFILSEKLVGGSIHVVTKVIYGHSVVLGVLLSLRVPTRKKRNVKGLDFGEGDEEDDDGVALTSTSNSTQEII